MNATPKLTKRVSLLLEKVLAPCLQNNKWRIKDVSRNDYFTFDRLAIIDENGNDRFYIIVIPKTFAGEQLSEVALWDARPIYFTKLKHSRNIFEVATIILRALDYKFESDEEQLNNLIQYLNYITHE